MGVFDSIGEALFGSVPTARPSGAFPNLGELGETFSQFLLERMQTPIDESEEFRLGSARIQDTATAAAARARQRLGDTASTRGFLDSGIVQRGLRDIERAELESTLGAERDLFLGLLARQTEDVLPFLAAGSGESVSIQNTNISSALTQRGQAMDLFTHLVPGGSAVLGNLFG